MDDVASFSARRHRQNPLFGAGEGTSWIDEAKRGSVDRHKTSRHLQHSYRAREMTSEPGPSPRITVDAVLSVSDALQGGSPSPYVSDPPRRSPVLMTPAVRYGRRSSGAQRASGHRDPLLAMTSLPVDLAAHAPTSLQLQQQAPQSPQASLVAEAAPPEPIGAESAAARAAAMQSAPAAGAAYRPPTLGGPQRFSEGAAFRRMGELVRLAAGGSLGAALLSAACLVLGGPSFLPYALYALGLSGMAFAATLGAWWLACVCLADEPAAFNSDVGPAAPGSLPGPPTASTGLFGLDLASERIEWSSMREATDATFSNLTHTLGHSQPWQWRASFNELRTVLRAQAPTLRGADGERAARALHVLDLLLLPTVFRQARNNAQGAAGEQPLDDTTSGAGGECDVFVQAIGTTYELYKLLQRRSAHGTDLGPLWQGIINNTANVYDPASQALYCPTGLREHLHGAMLGWHPDVLPFVSPPAHLLEKFGTEFHRALAGREPTDQDWLLVGQHMMAQGRELYAHSPAMLADLRKRYVLPLLRGMAPTLCSEADGQWLRSLEFEPACPLSSLREGAPAAS